MCMSRVLTWVWEGQRGHQRKDCRLGLVRKKNKDWEGSFCLKQGFGMAPNSLASSASPNLLLG